MFIVTHAAVGALVGAYIPNRFLAFVSGFVLHIVADMIPHGDEHMLESYKSGAKVKLAVAYCLIDGILTFYFSMLMIAAAPAQLAGPVLWGIIGGVLPDLLVGVYEVTKIRPFFKKFAAWHYMNHHRLIAKFRDGRDIPFKIGFAYQIIASIILIKIAM